MASRVKIATIAATCSLVLCSAIPVLGQTPPPRNGVPARGPMVRLLRTPYRPIVLELRGLRLTREQRQQVLGIFKTHQPDLQALAGKVRAARQRWQQSGKIDIQERTALNEQRQAILKAVRGEVLAVLTPEQQKQIEARRQRLLRRRDA
jgi:Spy/CpxP family protein refolding chaperone